ncbi:glycoside hydrolase family 10 protein [Actinocorallia longicatena]|uniref:Family 10 glycosylhydrolase n=1 Tax=Actinocorallia longicatena TaxID=111803 RepID=A0ABP6PVU4_9ACTN
MSRGRRTAAGLITAGLVLTAGCAGEDPQTALPPVGNLDLAQASTAECPKVPATGDDPAKQVRGMWISSVYGGDWPGDPELSVAKKKAGYRKLLDRAKAMRLNTVFMQIRPAGDAFYASPYEPWSAWLTGKAGKDPGWDVLKFLIDEAHARDLEFHAWFNPYRVGQDNKRAHLAPSSPARKHPDWVHVYGKYLWYDPGLPQVRELALNAVLDVVRKYDVDGVHFDDYFYPYPTGKDFPDAKTFKAYGKGYASKAAWRRANVDQLVQRVSGEVKKAKSWVKFGISPFGIWRNKRDDPAGSNTKGLDSYAEIYGDTRKWVRQRWLDYVLPQLYWPIGDKAADYRTLVAWWANLVKGTGVQLTIGQAAYRIGEDKIWKKPDELSRHLTLNRKYPEVRGDVFFSAADVSANRGGFGSVLLRDHYRTPALIPPSKGAKAPAAPAGVKVSGAAVSWKGSKGATSYAVYRRSGKAAACGTVRPADLIGTTRGTSFTDTGRPSGTVTYTVTALDRGHAESAPARTVTAAR